MASRLSSVRLSVQSSWSGPEGAFSVLAPEGCAAVTSIFEGPDVVAAACGEVLWAEGSLPRGATAAELVATAFRARGEGFMKSLDGTFAALVLDRRSGSWLAATDRFARLPLSHARHGDAAFVSTHLLAFSAIEELGGELDEASVFEFLAFGYVLGRRTHRRAVRRLPPASCLVVGPVSDEVRRYFELRWQPRREPANVVERSREVAEVLVRVAARLAGDDRRVGIQLSGGHDSRAILAASLKAGAKPIAVSFGADGSKDITYSRMLTRALDVPHRIVPLSAARLVSYAPFAVRATDGMYNLFHTQGLSSLEEVADEVDLLLNGATALDGVYFEKEVREHGELLAAEPYPGFLIRDLIDAKLPDGRTFGSVFVGGTDLLVRPELRSSFARSLEASAAEAVGPSSDSVPIWDRSEQIYLHQRMPRFTMSGMSLCGHFRPVRFPLLDIEFVEFCLGLPPRFRTEEKEILSHAIRHLSPAAADAPLTGTERPAGLPRSRDLAARLVNRGRKALRALGLLSPGPSRTFVDYEGWLRSDQALRSFVDDHLLAKAPWVSRWVAADEIRRLVEAQRAGWDGSELIGRLLTLELYRCEFGGGP
jgi:hypothetical protein